jgi:hypothetical protein
MSRNTLANTSLLGLSIHYCFLRRDTSQPGSAGILVDIPKK